jgi:PAS domain S-box-containing protein
MNTLHSYDDLQKRISYLENELDRVKSNHISKIFDLEPQLFYEICEHSKNAIAIFETPDNGKNFIIKYLNFKAEEVESVKRTRIIGTNLANSFPSVKHSGFLNTLKNVYKNSKPEDFPAVTLSSGKIIEWKQNYIYKLTDTLIVSIYVDETEHKTREIELFEHREKLQIAMEAANYYSFEINLKKDKITTDIELYLHLGYSKTESEELLKKAGSLIHPEDFKKASKLISKHSRKIKPSLKTEFRIKNNSGRWVWFSANGKIIERDKASNPVRFVGLIKNVQEEKEVLFKLQNSEEKFKSLATLLPEVIYETDVHGNITFVNLKAFEIFEYTPEDLEKGLNVIQMLAPEEFDRAKTNLQKVFEKENSIGEEYQAVTKSGKRFPILVYTNPIKNNNTVVGLRGIIVNITDLKKTQEQLRNSEEILRQLSENIDDAFWLRSLDEKFIYANPSCYKIVGDNIKEIFENFDEYINWVHPEDREQILEKRNKNLEQQEKINFYEHRIINDNGEVRWLWIRTFPVYNANGQLYRRAGIASDITKQKNLMNDLLVAKEKAEESDNLKSAFLANMSHEIRTPMNGILGFAELLKDEDITEEDKMHYLRIIDSNSKQLLNLINDIIDVAKIEAGQLTVHKTISEINPVLQEVYRLFKEEQKRINKENITFNLLLPEANNTTLFTDIFRLKQILHNLISNAFKFTESGTITFGYMPVSESGKSYVQFFVSDTGIGIPENMITFIFERFGQVQPQRFKNRHGTGLGLAISKGLIELLGGKIWVESEPQDLRHKKTGHSTFYFTIPVNKLQGSTYEPKIQKKNKTEMKDLHHVSILVVEDDSDNLEFLRRLIQKFGARVVIAKNGREAIKAVETDNQIQLVLMDIRLPDMDGFETTQRIKAINPQLKVIAQTAYAMYNDREICLENGCDDYMSKPLNKDILFKKINQYIYN